MSVTNLSNAELMAQLGMRTNTPDQFKMVYGPAAERAGKAIGVDPGVLLGQWGLETGWGRSIVPGTNNLGNIKDFSGSGVAATDNMTGSRDKYRAYESLDAFADDYAGLISRRYKDAVGSGSDVRKFATALKAGGYAEDPAYIDKLVSIYQKNNPGLLDRAAAAVIPSAQASEPQGLAAMSDAELLAALGQERVENPMPLNQENTHTRTDGELMAQLGYHADQGGIDDGIIQGMRDPIDAGAQMLRRVVPEGLGNAIDQFGNKLADMGLPVARSEGVAGVDQMVNDVNDRYEQSRKLAGRNGIDFARIGGNIVGTAPLLAAVPGGQAALMGRVLAGTVQGGAIGALNPVIGEKAQSDFWGSKLGQTGTGAAFGAATPVITGAIGRLISPLASRASSPAQLLRNEGVQLTPGQALGGTLMRLEDRAMSAPIVGDAIRSARTRGNESLNRAVYNRVLEPIGQTTNKVGREAVDDVAAKVSQAYDDVLAKVSFRPDNAFSQSIANLRSMAAQLPEREATQFERVLQREVLGPLSKGRAIDGMTFKGIESQLTQQISKFKAAPDAYQNDLGNALGEVLRSLRDNLVRTNPGQAQQLQSVNTAYANFVRLQGAAGKIGAQDGVFAPQQLANAVRMADRTKRKGAYAKGAALMQDLSDAAQSRMSAQIPDSGTAERLMANVLAGGLGYMANPAIPAGLAAASVPYLPGMSRAATAAIMNRPANAQLLADQLKRLPPGFLGLLAQ